MCVFPLQKWKGKPTVPAAAVEAAKWALGCHTGAKSRRRHSIASSLSC